MNADIERDYIQNLAKLKSRRKAAKLLDAAGFDVTGMIQYGSCHTGSASLPMIRRVLGCPLKYSGSWAKDRITVQCRAVPVRFPGVTIYYDRELPKNAKCKIVTTRELHEESRLLCEA